MCRHHTVCKTVVIDKTFIILIGNDISIKIVVFCTFKGIFDFTLGGLKDYFLHLLNMSSFFTLVGFLLLYLPSLPSVSGIEAFSRLKFLVYFLEAAFGFFMPNNVTVGTPLCKAWAIICIVASRSLAQLTKSRGYQSEIAHTL
jgi:hypothetical protein